MYVCICNAITDTDIVGFLEKGFSVEEIKAFTGCSTCCGTCLDQLNDIAGTHIEKDEVTIALRVKK